MYSALRETRVISSRAVVCKQLTGIYNSGTFPLLRKVPLIPRNDKIRAGKLGALKKPVVWFVGRNSQCLIGRDKSGHSAQGGKRLLNSIHTDTAELRTGESQFV